MSEMDVEKEIAKLKFQVKQLGEAVDFHDHPIAALVVGMDWNEEDLNAAHDIFEAASNLLHAGNKPDFGDFERKLEDRFCIGYQGIKPIVLAFYENSQWLDVCEWYVESHSVPGPPAEFHQIAESIRQRKPEQKGQ